MKLYWEIFKFNLLDEFVYPIEIFAFLARKMITLGFLILFWFVISTTNPDIFTFKQILAYFLISEAVQDLTFSSAGRFGRSIQRKIKFGFLSNYLIKPVNTLGYLFSAFAGGRTSVTLYALATLILGIFIYPPTSFVNYPLFILSLILTTIAGIGINIYLGIIAFYTPEASGIKNVYEHVSKILSGSLIPLTYFPTFIKNFAMLTPFPVLSFFPTSILQSGGLNPDTYMKLGLSLFWAIILITTSNYYWKKALRNYDGVGI